jgi:hypothetical protein
MKYSSVKDLKYIDSDHSLINCIVCFDELGEIPFTASRYDIENHSREIFHKAVSGEFGHILDFESQELGH